MSVKDKAVHTSAPASDLIPVLAGGDTLTPWIGRPPNYRQMGVIGF